MAERINARMGAVGGVFDMCGPSPRCIGSCSAFGSATTFVTAAHIVAGRTRDQIAVNHFGHSKHQFSPINEIVVKEGLIGLRVGRHPRGEGSCPTTTAGFSVKSS